MVYFDCDDSQSVNFTKDIIDKMFDCDLKRTKQFSRFDLRDSNKKVIVEVKNRNNEYSKYPTTMIGENKYIRANHYYKKDYKVLFVFIFTDGTYYYEYDGEDIKAKIGGRRDRGIKEYKNYIYIPIEKLKKIEI
jgi:hypothetical protein